MKIRLAVIGDIPLMTEEERAYAKSQGELYSQALEQLAIASMEDVARSEDGLSEPWRNSAMQYFKGSVALTTEDGIQEECLSLFVVIDLERRAVKFVPYYAIRRVILRVGKEALLQKHEEWPAGTALAFGAADVVANPEASPDEWCFKEDVWWHLKAY